MKKSMIDHAYDILTDNGKSMSFLELWEIVAQQMGFNQTQKDDNIAQFYSDLSMDGRFANLKGNVWDLRKRASHAETVIDPDAISVEDEEDEILYDDEDDIPLEDETDDDSDEDDE